MSDYASMDFTQKTGSELKRYITSEFNYKIVVKLTYNTRDAYWPFESTYINIGSEIYNELTQPAKVIDLYVHYYNYIKPNNHKDSHAPGTITHDMIDCIMIDRLSLNYIDYYSM
jgi:hypothetical protein